MSTNTTFKITFRGMCLFDFSRGLVPPFPPIVRLPFAQFGYEHTTHDTSGTHHHYIEAHTAYVSALPEDVIASSYARTFEFRLPGAEPELVFPLFDFADLSIGSGLVRSDTFERTAKQAEITSITRVCHSFILDMSTANLAARMDLQGYGGILDAYVPAEGAQYCWLTVTGDGNPITIATGDGTIVLRAGSNVTIGNEYTGRFQAFGERDHHHWMLYYMLATTHVNCTDSGGPTVGCSNSNYP